jgi:hypothetical protein
MLKYRGYNRTFTGQHHIKGLYDWTEKDTFSREIEVGGYQSSHWKATKGHYFKLGDDRTEIV